MTLIVRLLLHLFLWDHILSFLCFRDDDVSRASVNFGLSVLSLGTKFIADETSPEASIITSLESAVAGSLFVMEIASSSRLDLFSLNETPWESDS